MAKSAGLFAIIPTAIFLTISFFVLLAASKVEVKGLKVFGYSIAVLLWISAALALTMGISGNCPMMKCMKQGMMDSGRPMHRNMQGMQNMQDMQKMMPKE